MLLKSMMSVDGEKSAIQDMAIRQRIANFPSRLYDVDILSKLKSEFTADHVTSHVTVVSQLRKRVRNCWKK